MSHQLPYSYETEVEWAIGKKASLRSSDLPTLQVAPPPEFHGEPGVWTPEHLYVAAVNACFAMTFLGVAEFSKFEFSGFSSKATGKVDKINGSGYEVTEIVLKPTLVVRDARDIERATRLLEKAERNCLISKSIKTAIRMEPEINSEQAYAVVA